MSDDVRIELLPALLNGARLAAVVPIALDIVERDPLASAGSFNGDLLRGLMEVRGHFWSRHPRLYDRYRAVVRLAAAERRHLPIEARMEFWSAIEPHGPITERVDDARRFD